MANTIIEKETIITGNKGDRGDTPESDTTVPNKAILYYDSDSSLPTGYTLYRN